MKKIRLAIQLIMILFLLGKTGATVFALEIKALGAVMEAEAADWSEESSGEDESFEADEEVLNPVPFLVGIRFLKVFNIPFYAFAPREYSGEVTVPPPQG